MTINTQNTRVILAGTDLLHTCFSIQTTTLPTVRPGEILVQVIYLGINAGMRSRLGIERDGAGTLHPGDCPTSDAVVRILESENSEFPPGSYAFRQWQPWEKYSAVTPTELTALPEGDPLWFATILGHTGFTAWVSLHLAGINASDHLLVSSAAGGVGVAAVQFALAKGAKVTGIASGKRCEAVRSLGAECVDRQAIIANEISLEPFTVFHDGVGGEILEKAIDAISFGGRIMICGALDGTSPRNYRRMIHKELNMRGFTVMNHLEIRPKFWEEGIKLLQNQKLQPIYQKHKGIASIGKAFCGMFHGQQAGRHIIEI